MGKVGRSGGKGEGSGHNRADGGEERRHRYHSSFSSDSSSDSDNEFCDNKRMKKHWKKQFKRMKKYGHFRHFMADPRLEFSMRGRGGFGPFRGFGGLGGRGFVGHGFGHWGRPYMGCSVEESEQNWSSKTLCTLCYHRIKPLVDTEVLECGHIYHRLCLKELLDLSQNRDLEQTDFFCSECKEKIEENLMNKFKERFTGQPIGSNGFPVVDMD